MEKHAAVAAGTTRCSCGNLAVGMRQDKEAGVTRIQTLEEQQRDSR